MRIAIITPGFSASEDDWCIPALLNLVRTLSSEHEVVVFTLRYPHSNGRYRIFDADVRAFAGRETAGFGRPLLLMRALGEVLRLHNETRFDVIHGFWADEPGFVAVAAGRLGRVPTVVSIMGGELVALPDIGYGGQTVRVNRWLTRVSLRLASRITVGSASLRNTALLRVGAERVVDAPLGVDSNLFHPCAGATDEDINLVGSPALLSVGSLVPVKDHEMLLRAMTRMTGVFPDVHLHIVGDGPLKHQLFEMAHSLGLSRRVKFHGNVLHHQMPEYYRSADLLVVTSRHESQSMVALEAAACGCSMLGTAVGILPEISPPSRSLPPGDSRAFSAALIDVLKDPARVAESRDVGAAFVQHGYTLQHTVSRLLDLYRSLVK